jgi:hypothetical protein
MAKSLGALGKGNQEKFAEIGIGIEH